MPSKKVQARLGNTTFNAFVDSHSGRHLVRVTAVRKLVEDSTLVALRRQATTDDSAYDADVAFTAGVDDTAFLQRELSPGHYEHGGWRFEWMETHVRCFWGRAVVIDILPLATGLERLTDALREQEARLLRKPLNSRLELRHHQRLARLRDGLLERCVSVGVPLSVADEDLAAAVLLNACRQALGADVTRSSLWDAAMLAVRADGRARQDEAQILAAVYGRIFPEYSH